MRSIPQNRLEKKYRDVIGHIIIFLAHLHTFFITVSFPCGDQATYHEIFGKLQVTLPNVKIMFWEVIKKGFN